MRVAGGFVWPFRIGALLLFAAGLPASRGSLRLGVELFAGAGALLLAARELVRLRWPALSRYVVACADDLPPRDWQTDLTSSPSHVVWMAARPGLERWCDAHQRYLYRGLSQRPSVLHGTSVTDLARDFSRHQLSDYVARCDSVAYHLTEEEVMTVRGSGVLPRWFWAALANERLPVDADPRDGSHTVVPPARPGRTRAWAKAAGIAIVAVIGLAFAVRWGGDGTRAARVTLASEPRPTSAQAICERDLRGAVNPESTTLGEARRTDIGGMAPGLMPAEGAFPDLPDTAPAAWCWALASSQSPGTDGSDWSWYLALPDGRTKFLITLGGISKPPAGPPSLK